MELVGEKIETAIYELNSHNERAYKKKAREVVSNLRKYNDLQERILSGAMKPDELINKNTSDVYINHADEAIKSKIRKLQEDEIQEGCPW